MKGKRGIEPSGPHHITASCIMSTTVRLHQQRHDLRGKRRSCRDTREKLAKDVLSSAPNWQDKVTGDYPAGRKRARAGFWKHTPLCHMGGGLNLFQWLLTVLAVRDLRRVAYKNWCTKKTRCHASKACRGPNVSWTVANSASRLAWRFRRSGERGSGAAPWEDWAIAAAPKNCARPPRVIFTRVIFTRTVVCLKRKCHSAALDALNASFNCAPGTQIKQDSSCGCISNGPQVSPEGFKWRDWNVTATSCHAVHDTWWDVGVI